MLLKSLAA